MRTEEELRVALTPETADPARAERVVDAVLVRTAEPARRRRPMVVGLAVAVALAVVVGFAVTNLPRSATPADPPTPTPTPTGAPRAAGNWRMVHRVDVPAGWRVVLRDVSAAVESTELMRDDGANCVTEVFGRGTRPTPVDGETPPSLEPVDVSVRGVKGYWDGYRTLRWSYREDAVAQVTCLDGGLERAQTIADRMVFASTALRVPFRLGEVPEGYRLNHVVEEGDDSAPASVLTLLPTDPDPAWEIEVLVAEARDPQRYRSPSAERATIAGFPAWLDPKSGSLELDTDPYRIMLHFAYGQESDRWAQGRRDQLVRLAESLELAPDLGDRESWFDAEEALPD